MTEVATNNLMRGTVDLLVLRALSGGALHGFAIARWIREGSRNRVSFEDAALYQSLHRLERQGLVESEWGRTDKNRKARFYSITAPGRRRLRAESGAFRRYSDAVTLLLDSGA